MPWFKPSSIEPLTVAMSGVTLGNRVLVIGCRDAPLIAALAIKAGLTGRACAVDEAEGRLAATAKAVEQEGALVEMVSASLMALPYDAAAFDVVVMRDVLADAAPQTRPALVAEAQRVLRPGGRCIVIDTASRAGLGGLVSRPVGAEYFAAGGAPPLFISAGFAAVRTLAERERMTFVEGVKRSG